MKLIVWHSRGEIRTPGTPSDGGRSGGQVIRLSLRDKFVVAVLALGLLAVGGVLLAAGLALLATLGAAGAVVGGGLLLRHRLFGHRAPPLAPGEIPADGAVLPPEQRQGALPKGR